MKKILTFIPLGVGISSAIIYVFNALQFKVINNSYTMLQILSSLRIYLYISIIGFLVYFIIRAILIRNEEEVIVTRKVVQSPKEEVVVTEKVITKPKEEVKIVKEVKEDNVKIVKVPEVRTEIKEVIITGNKYCSDCGEKIFDTDNYCKNCGSYQKNKKSGKSKFIIKLIYVIKIVIMLLLIYFLLNMLFNYKEKIDPSFKSPLRIEITK